MFKNILFYLNHLDILIFVCSVLVIITVILVISKILNIYETDSEQSSVYECGFEAIASVRNQFDISYVTIAVLYLIFDVEILILLPIVIHYTQTSAYLAFMFIVVLLGGFYMEWLRGALVWMHSGNST